MEAPPGVPAESIGAVVAVMRVCVRRLSPCAVGAWDTIAGPHTHTLVQCVCVACRRAGPHTSRGTHKQRHTYTHTHTHTGLGVTAGLSFASWSALRPHNKAETVVRNKQLISKRTA